jgi:hypothetical protein
VGGKNYSTPTELTVKQDANFRNYSTPTEYAVKNIPCLLVCGEKYSTSTESAVKNIPHLLSML